MDVYDSSAILSPCFLSCHAHIRTFLNCHKLCLNTVSISLRAKIKPARDIHISMRVLCSLAPWNVALFAFGTHFVLPCLLLEHLCMA